jgi:hypothetical protein
MDNVKLTSVPPPVIAMQIAVENKLDTHVSLRIRHVYFSSWASNPTIYSDWSAIDLAAATSETIGNETASYRYENEDRKMTGFILLDSLLNKKFEEADGSSSFEIEITTEDETICLAGYKTETSEFTETELGDLQIEHIPYPGGRASWMYFKDNHCLITVPFLLQASLSINADGTCTFEYDNGEWQQSS